MTKWWQWCTVMHISQTWEVATKTSKGSSSNKQRHFKDICSGVEGRISPYKMTRNSQPAPNFHKSLEFVESREETVVITG